MALTQGWPPATLHPLLMQIIHPGRQSTALPQKHWLAELQFGALDGQGEEAPPPAQL